ncbi:PadR family transcriptional regulator [Streptomyces sp. NRRL F-2664]|uniref:PadR family transcriptional regulator n=1 Tax=Streptomyces sp. NRRL F-2664 TaxID=1463842 RepID=UPI000689ACB0|nr:PadR family transcriptional regulator [Streptomyces sp. NRRL F-2664]
MTSSHTAKRQEKQQHPDLPPTAWAVLGLLSFPGERTGYELKKWADSSLRFFYWSPAISQIYAELRRLEDIGYASSARSGPEEARAKRRYSITGAGRAALSRWAADTADAGPPVLKHGLLLRVWLGHLAEPARLRAMVEAHLERTRGELAAVREAVEQAAGVPEWDFPAVALRWSERQHLAELELGEALLADLGRLSARVEATGRQAGGDAPTPG